MGIQINGNTNNINAGIGSLSIEDINELDIVGVATAANFKTGVSNLHSVGLTLSGGQIDVGSNIKIGTAGVVTATSFVGSGANLTGLPAETTINNRADNRVLTATGSANVLNAESNVHIDGSGRLMIGTTTEGNESADELTVASSGNTGITIRSGASSNASLFFSDATSGADEYRGFVQYIQSNDDLKFGTATLERLRITSEGQVKLTGSNSGNHMSTFGTNVGGLTIDDVGQNHTALQVSHGSNNVFLVASSNNSAYLSSYGTGSLIFELTGGGGGRERLRIDANGKIGVGGAPSAWQAATTTKALQIGNACLFNYNDTYFHLGQNFYFDGSNYKYINNGWATRLIQNAGEFTFLVSDASGSANGNINFQQKVQITTGGDVEIADGNLKFETAGKGIDFSAQAHPSASSNTTVNAELLDHYEEGTFQPIIKRLMTNNVTETNFYNQGTRQGNYLRIGNRVWVTGRIHWSGGSTGSGSLIMVNFPYTPTSGGANEVPITVGYRNGFNYNNLCGYMAPGLNRFFIQWSDTNASHNISPSACNSSGTFYFALNYQL